VTRDIRDATIIVVALLSACAPAVPPATSPTPIGTTVVAVQTLGGTSLVSVQANGRDEAALFILDTGASLTILTPLYATRLGLTVPERATHMELTGIGGHKISVPLVTLRRLAVGQAVAENFTVGVYNALPDAPTVDGILGLDFLRRFKFTIDTAANVLRLEPRAPR
jgi:predicted aspartyl protease